MFFERVYRRSASPERLPWHRDHPPNLLERVIARRARKGRALDIGCGSGTFSVYLARSGYDVTAVDFAAGAIEMTRRAAERADVTIDVQHADIMTWSPESSFDLILDSGCMHGLRGERRGRYKQKILSWLAADGDFVLVHFGKRHRLDWHPFGPIRATRADVLALYSPELVEIAHDEEDLKISLIVLGRVVRLSSYLLRHNLSLGSAAV
jgi:SAM-dependent methyltransferase